MKKWQTLSLKKSSGMSLIELMLILSIAGVVAAVSTNLIMRMIENQKRNNFIAQVHLLRETYLNMLNDNRSWAATVNHTMNTSLVCLRNKVACTIATNQWREFTPVPSETAANGVPYAGYSRVVTSAVAGSGPQAGFTKTGTFCNTFDSANPAPNCPVQIMFESRFMQTGIVDPEVEIRMRFFFAMGPRTGLGPPLNPDRFNPPNITRAGGTTTIALGNCPANQVIYGFQADGTPLCNPETDYRPPPAPPATPAGPPCPTPSPKSPAPSPKSTPCATTKR